MVRSQRLKPIKKMAQTKEKSAAKALGESLEKQRVENSKLEQLECYKKEYLNEMEYKIRQGVTGATLQHYHHFLNKIDQAIIQQNEVLKQCGEQLSYVQGQWQDKRSRSRAITQVMDKMQDSEKKIINKKEATQNDELSTQAFLRNQTKTI